MESKLDLDPPSTQRPNIVVIMADDQVRSDLGATGGEVLTPHIDKLAEDGIFFQNFHVPTAVCVPSRYTLLTGQDPSRAPRSLSYARNQLYYDQLTSTFNANEVPTVAQVLQASGYKTGLVGKMHWKPGAPADTYEELVADAKEYGFDYAASLYNGNSYDYHNQDWVDAGTQTFLNEVSNKEPFFLLISTTLQHSNDTSIELGGSDPAQAVWDDEILSNTYASDLGGSDPNAVLDLNEVRQNREQIRQKVLEAGLDLDTADSTWLDQGVGKVMQQLNTRELAENTLIIYLSDNGREGGKGSVYEAGTNVAMMLYWKGKTELLADSRIYAQGEDIVPTILEVAQIARPENLLLDGESLASVLEGNDVRKTQNYGYTGIGHTRSITKNGMKYVAFRLPDDLPEGTTPLNQPTLNDNTGWINQKSIAGTYPQYLKADQLYDLRTDLNLSDPNSPTYDSREQKNLVNNSAYRSELIDLQATLAKRLSTLPGSFGEFDYEVSTTGPFQIQGDLDLSARYNAISLAEGETLGANVYTVLSYTGKLIGSFEFQTQMTDLGYQINYQTPGEIRLVKLAKIETLIDQKVVGTNQSDTLAGSSGNDTIIGGGSNDFLQGKQGSDRLIGGAGSNILQGGSGRDRFILTHPKFDPDEILDFNVNEDLIILRHDTFSELEKGALQQEQFSIGISATRQQERIIYNPNNGLLLFDSDGSGGLASTKLAQLNGSLSLSFANFQVS